MMQNLSFDFDHPVSGQARFFPVGGTGGHCHSNNFKCDGKLPLQIAVGHLPQGRWKLELDWELDDRSYSLTRDFTVSPE